MEREKTVAYKSKRFAIRIVKLYRYLCEEKKEYVLSKLYIAYKEANETLYWLELLYETEYMTKQVYESGKADCEEIKRILSSATKTVTDALNNSSLLTPNS